MQLLHALFSTRSCKKHLVWRQNVLMCSVCGNIAGFRYQIGDEDDGLRIFLFPQFASEYERILHRVDTRRITQVNDVLGHISFVDFETAIMEMRDKIADITYHAFDDLGFYTPSDDEEEFDDEEETTDQVLETFGGHDADPVDPNGDDADADGQCAAPSVGGIYVDEAPAMAALDGG